MPKQQTDMETTGTEASSANEIVKSNSLLTRRQMLGMSGMPGLAKLYDDWKDDEWNQLSVLNDERK